MLHQTVDIIVNEFRSNVPFLIVVINITQKSFPEYEYAPNYGVFCWIYCIFEPFSRFLQLRHITFVSSMKTQLAESLNEFTSWSLINHVVQFLFCWAEPRLTSLHSHLFCHSQVMWMLNHKKLAQEGDVTWFTVTSAGFDCPLVAW